MRFLHAFDLDLTRAHGAGRMPWGAPGPVLAWPPSRSPA